METILTFEEIKQQYLNAKTEEEKIFVLVDAYFEGRKRGIQDMHELQNKSTQNSVPAI